MSAMFLVFIFTLSTIPSEGHMDNLFSSTQADSQTDTAGCSPNSLYCGHEKPRMKVMGQSSDDPISGYLYRCSPDSGRHLWLEEKCHYGCTIRTDGNSYCNALPTGLAMDNPMVKCTAGTNYCGHQLQQLGFRNSLKNAVYRCSSNGQSYTHVQTCYGKCVNDTRVRCSQECVEGSLYCGSELQRLEGWSGRVTYYLYRCINGNSSELVERCSSTCIANTDEGSFCAQNCSPGQFYCGHQLARIGYKGPWSSKRLQSIFFCTKTFYGNYTRRCSNKCLIGETVTCSPSCTDGYTYCGHELLKLEWTNVESNSLYQCVGKTNITKINTYGQMCDDANTDCVIRNGCQEGKYYCGSELPQLGFKWAINSNSNVSIDPSARYVCKNNVPNLYRECHDGCISSTENTDAYCLKECTRGWLYCGFDLIRLGWTDINPHGLFYCRSEENAAYLKGCRSKCVRTDGHARCTKECNPAETYCGHELNQLGFQDVDTNHLYRCTNGTEVELQQACAGDCEVVNEEHSKCLNHTHPAIESCGIPYQGFYEPLIRDGRDSKRGKWPWMASLHLNWDGVNCGGTLIGPRWVLSAAHCFDNAKTGTVTLGATNFFNRNERGQVKVKIDDAILHPEYRTTSCNSDIALVRLKTPVRYSRFVRPACLPTSTNTRLEGKECVVIGWGKTRARSPFEEVPRNLGHSPDILQEGTTTILPDKDCATSRTSLSNGREYIYNGSNMICAGPSNTDQVNTCSGDSGGPLLSYDGEKWIVEGITSYGPINSCEFRAKSTSEVKTRVASYLSWIQEHMKNSAEDIDFD